MEHPWHWMEHWDIPGHMITDNKPEGPRSTIAHRWFGLSDYLVEWGSRSVRTPMWSNKSNVMCFGVSKFYNYLITKVQGYP